MQPDRTLVQLVSWVNLIEEENAKLLTVARQLQEENKTLKADNDKLTKQVKDLKEED